MGPVLQFPPRHVSRILVPLAFLLLTALAWLAAPATLGRKLTPWEVLVVLAVLLGVGAWRRRQRLRRERQEMESMRDSALW